MKNLFLILITIGLILTSCQDDVLEDFEPETTETPTPIERTEGASSPSDLFNETFLDSDGSFITADGELMFLSEYMMYSDASLKSVMSLKSANDFGDIDTSYFFVETYCDSIQLDPDVFELTYNCDLTRNHYITEDSIDFFIGEGEDIVTEICVEDAGGQNCETFAYGTDVDDNDNDDIVYGDTIVIVIDSSNFSERTYALFEVHGENREILEIITYNVNNFDSIINFVHSTYTFDSADVAVYIDSIMIDTASFNLETRSIYSKTYTVENDAIAMKNDSTIYDLKSTNTETTLNVVAFEENLIYFKFNLETNLKSTTDDYYFFDVVNNSIEDVKAVDLYSARELYKFALGYYQVSDVKSDIYGVLGE